MSAELRRLGSTALVVSPVSLGGNVFGWTADATGSFAILDAYVDAGGNFIDTADSYSEWVPGHTGGESESILGDWIRRRGFHDDVVIATKVGRSAKASKLSKETITAAAEDSCRRLGVEAIDLYYAHRDDRTTPLDETISAFDDLVRRGLVRYVGASNYSAPRLEQAVETASQMGVASFCALQAAYNLVHRREFERDLSRVCQRLGVAGIAYSALADGFLTGKYRKGRASPRSERREDAIEHMTERGLRVLDALEAVALRHDVMQAAIAIAWLLHRQPLTALTVSARTTGQLGEVMRASQVTLGQDDVHALDAASEPLSLKTKA